MSSSRQIIPFPPETPEPTPRQIKHWMTAVTTFLRTLPQREAGEGAAVLLASLTSDAKAQIDGILMYDTNAGNPVVSKNGAWVSLSGGGGSITVAANSILGNNTGAPASPMSLSATQATAMLNPFTSALKGLTPASSGGTTNFLRADGSWVAPPGGVSDGDKGDITVSGGGTVWSIDAGVVTLAQMANVATGTVFYRKTAATGAPEVQTLATLKTDLGLSGTNTGDQTITLTGDVTGSGTGSFAAAIAAGAVTLAKMASLAANSIMGNNTGSAATPIALTATQATAMLDAFTSVAKGLAPASGGGTANFLRADGTWAAPAGGGGYTSPLWSQLG